MLKTLGDFATHHSVATLNEVQCVRLLSQNKCKTNRISFYIAQILIRNSSRENKHSLLAKKQAIWSIE